MANVGKILEFFEKAKIAVQQTFRTGYGEALYKYMFTANPADKGFAQRVDKELRGTIAPPLRFGLAVIAVGFGFFVLWGGLAPLDSASIAEGTITVAGHRKTIQHLEGGVIEEIFVSDGQVVPKGFILMKLNDASARAQLRIIMSQLNFATAVQARLNAERNGYDKIVWDKEAFDLFDTEIKEIMKTQESLLLYKREEMRANVSIVHERLAQGQEELVGLAARKASYESQIKLVAEELSNTQALYDKGLALRPKLLELRRTSDELTAGLADTKARIAAARESIAENNLRLLNIEAEYHKELSKELKENHSQILDLLEKYTATNDVVERMQIKAPVGGIVTDLQYHTIGGVITPGQKIMEIVPQDEKLIIEAKVRTQDIDSIYPGLTAKVQLGAYKSRLVPRLSARVIYVSADKAIDTQTGMPYYLARIEIDENELSQLNLNVKLYPGMPVTVFIVKGTRTFLEYMLSPIRDSFFKAFKEV